MTFFLPLLLLLGSAFISGTAMFLALMISRKARRDIERRVELAAGHAGARNVAEPAKRPVPAKKFSAGALLRRLFSFGSARRWGMRMNGFVLLVTAGGAAIGTWLLIHGALHFSIWVAVPMTAAAFLFAPRSLLRRQQRRTEQQFMVLFPDSIDMVIRMLRAGLPVNAAVRANANEAPAPVNEVFKLIADQVDIGIPFEDALAAAGDTVGLPDFRFFSVAVSLQRATGGNLAETLDVLSEIIRRRRTVRLRAQATTGEIRMSAYIVGALPFLVASVLLVVNPAYLAPLIDDPRGNVIVGISLLSLALGYLTMRQMLQSVTTI